MALRDKKLPFDAKIAIVRALACYERPRDILAQLKENWNITVDRKALRHYDPACNPALDDELKALFQRTRESFWKEKDEEPLNCLNFRQRVRREILEAAGRNLPLQIEILSEAAKDEGGLFSRKPELGEAPNASKTPVFTSRTCAQHLTRTWPI